MRADVRGKAIAATASGALVAAVLGPIHQTWRSRPRDGFPLSYYPMFTAKRKASGQVTHLVGVTADGGTRFLPHGLAGSGGLNQVRRQLARSARRGTADRVCAAVAAKVAASGERGLADLVEVPDLIRDGESLGSVGHDQRGPDMGGHDVVDDRGRRRIEVGVGLVEEENPGRAQQRTGEQHPLSLAC